MNLPATGRLAQTRDVDISKFMSLVLRHAPEKAGLTLDAEGWAEFDALCRAVAKRFGASVEDVRRVVDDNPKRRFAIEGNRIRAVQGHSVDVDLGLKPAAAPSLLFHGTKAEFLPSILREGLRPASRHHVHLSADVASAKAVAARRRGDSAILRVESGRMDADGFPFFLSENGVWLTDHVPPSYISPLSDVTSP